MSSTETSHTTDERVGIGEASRILGVSAERVRQLTDEGKLPALRLKPTGFRVFFRADVERLKTERESSAEARQGLGGK